MSRAVSLKPALALVALLVMAISILFVFSEIQAEIAENSQLRGSVETSAAARQELSDLMSDFRDIEIGQRGYIITDNPRFLEPYDEARGRIPGRLKALLSKLPPGADLRAVTTLSRQKIAFAQMTIDLAAQGKTDTARKAVANGEGKRLMDAVRAEIRRLDHAETAHLATLTQARDQKRITAERLINGALAGLTILLTILSIAVWRTLRLRQAALNRIRGLSERNRAIFEGAVDGMLVLDNEGCIREANPSMTRLFGFSHDELVGMHNTALMAAPPPLDQSLAWLRGVGAAGASGSGERQEFIGRRADKSTLATDVAISRVTDGGDTTYVAVIRDVTERKRIEDMKTEFVSTVSHELRTPLTSIGGSLGLLSAGAAGPLGDKAARLVAIAHSNCERLIRLINDILDIEKIESGKMQFDLRRMPLGPLVERTAAANRAFGEAHSVTIEVSMPPWPISVMGDPDRLEQLLTNLVSNAVKHSPACGTVQIAVEIGGGRARIAVLDRGDGIPEDFRSRIFGKFAMADGSDSRRRGGTGLGLAIVREIAERHGGAVSFADRNGGGTVFTVDLPMADCEDMDICEAGTGNLPQVLHIDDDHDCLSVVSSAFAGRAVIVPVLTVAEARQRIAGTDFAAVIVDVVVPPDNGLDLVPTLRNAAPGLPIVVFTALDDVHQTPDVDAVLVKGKASVQTLVETTMALVSRANREAA